MPCYTVTTNTVTLNLADRGLITAALVALGANIYFNEAGRIAWTMGYRNYELDLANGQLTGEGSSYLVNEMKDKLTRQYSLSAVTLAAKKAGWKVKTGQDQKLQLRRRQ